MSDGCRKVDLQVARLKKNDFQNLGEVNHILNIEVAYLGLKVQSSAHGSELRGFQD